MSEDQKYLGDGAYVEDRGYDIRVYASNGLARTDEVFLDDEMMRSLFDFWKTRREA